MGRKRVIAPKEASLWLGVLLDASFDLTSKALDLEHSAETLNQIDTGKSWRARHARIDLLSIASDFTQYPHDFSDARRAELLLVWAERWVLPSEWSRLQARVRKRRQRL